jgi:uncharacterized membrane protein YsdA (DUF1294 family)
VGIRFEVAGRSLNQTPEILIVARRRTWLEWLNPFTRVQRWFTFGSILWLIGSTVLLVQLFRKKIPMSGLFAIYLLLTVACSAVAFVMYGIDKRRAVRQRPRVSERTLHLLALGGGWPGAYLASRLFRHKTLKISFRVVFWLTVALHVAIIGYGIWSGWCLDAIRALIGV